ncbi:hypothetical protein [Leptospira kirschneri]|uniref:hypothetical protein n=1 Tax=Leptospira kirschneri TaxID=29507 RepID=UPI0002BD4DFE|nr:hypothetical protein [Leptospira kirschneri]EMK07531.1 hypothetical protein LEP1GSC176_3939 [Leptospira kirschneri str. MMD1493]EPG48517.1 hypothetical protein LEP1GSC049_4106 [Leptospira kirschneri serovar Cynopteri str. 3522 CT]KPZ75143.1 hypothetical protein APS47_04595 [Leptospira kirschneri serovar Mozdok]WBF94209.1 hypothetical protein LIX31_14855 [Leptospira kirschneri]
MKCKLIGLALYYVVLNGIKIECDNDFELEVAKRRFDAERRLFFWSFIKVLLTGEYTIYLI